MGEDKEAATRAALEALLGWYAERARPFFAEWADDRLEHLDRDVRRLKTFAEASQEELPVCILGNSGVGKSTLLNAIVGKTETVLPQGGVGPLTAQATLVRYSAERYFRVNYLSKGSLNNLLFALERNFEKILRRELEVSPPPPDELEFEGTESDEALIPVLDEPDSETSETKPDEDKLDGYRSQARLLIQGNQFGAIEQGYLLDSIRTAMDLERRWGAEEREEDAERIAQLRRVLRRPPNQAVEVRAGSDMRAFLRELRLHAAGSLSPMIRTLEVGWDNELLADGLVLVDLPGVGVANDEYRAVTAEWIRKARAVVLVVDRSGVTEASADLLRSTGFLNSLLHDSFNDDAVPVHLLVAVVKIDLSADDKRRQERELEPPPHRKWLQHFEDVCQQAMTLVHDQVGKQLDKIARSGPEEHRADREAIMKRVMDSLEVHPVAALEYRNLFLDDEDERPRIKEAEQSRVPALIDALQAISSEHHANLIARMRTTADEFSRRTRGSLDLVRVKWEENARAEEEAAQLRDDLESFLAPLRRELLIRQGEFREFLRSSLPAQIEARVGEASHSARTGINRYLAKLENYHWATLRAAVRRGGTFVGAKHVDLPNELTLRFEEPVAIVWSKHILSVLRKRTRNLGEDYVALIGQIVEWTQGQGTRVKPQLVEALHEELKGDTKELSQVGKEAIAELREHVKEELFLAVNDSVGKSCRKFVNSKRDVGTGTKNRILAFIRNELIDSVIRAAAPAAQEVLARNYNEVQQEITSHFKKYPNPLDTAASAIVDSEQVRIRRSDAQKRKRVLAQIQEVLEATPGVLQTAVGSNES